MIDHIIDDYRIVASIINCIYTRLRTNKECDGVIAQAMMEKVNEKKALERLIRRHNLTSIASFTELSHQNIDFPVLTVDELKRYITYGEYQIEESVGYIQENFQKNSYFHILLCEKVVDDTKVLCCNFFSRHKSQKQFCVYVQYKPNEQSYNAIVGWYRNCKVGSRIVGCCSHVTAIIYYLSIYRHSEKRSKPKRQIDAIIDAKEQMRKTPNSLKRNLSLESQNEATNRTNKKNSSNSSQIPTNITESVPANSSISASSSFSPLIQRFLNHLPHCGGRINFDSKRQYQNFILDNTCSIDYIQYCLWLTNQLNNATMSLLESF